MEKWRLTITKVDNGFYLVKSNDDPSCVIQANENDNLKAYEELCWEVLEYFGYSGSKHDPERLFVRREKNE